MAASYPNSVKVFTTKNTDQIIDAAHPNDIQDEVVAIENGLLNGIAHNVTVTGDVTARDLTLSGGDLVFSTNGAIHRNTANGADDGVIEIDGGGGLGDQGRGALVRLNGNEHATRPGRAEIFLGNVAGSTLVVGKADGATAFSIQGDTGATAIPGTLNVTGIATLSASTIGLRGVIYTLPAADGAANEVLTTNGAGGLSWSPNASSLIMGSQASGLAAGATVFLSPVGANAAENNILISFPFACVLSDMRVRSGGSPGASQTYIFTLRKESVDQTLTATISGGGTSASDLVNTVTVAAGDALSVKVVCSAGANTVGGGSATFLVEQVF